MPKLRTDPPAQKIEIVQSFIRRLDDFKSKENQSIPLLGQFLARFKVGLPKLEQEYQIWQKATAPNFNIFRVLRLQRRETKLHSCFLAELLVPTGSHGQADTFLTAFLGLAKDVGLRCPSECGGDLDWRVTTEEAVNEHDRLDIVLRGTRHGCTKPEFIMVIENKIDAAEGTEQLRRYYDNWLQKQPADFRNLVFLTPDGREPETISKDKCMCLSYRDHVTKWLRNTRDQIKPQYLQFAIDQYLQVVDAL